MTTEAQTEVQAAAGNRPTFYRPGYVIVLIYFFFDYVRPQDTLPFLATIKIPLIVSAIAVLMWFFRGNRRAMLEPLIVLYLLFLAQTAISIFFVVNTYWAFKMFNILAVVLVAGVLPFISFMTQQDNINRFFRYWLIFHLYIAVMSIMAGGRGVGSFLGDENDLALALNMAMPYAYFLSLSPHARKSNRLLFIIIAVVLVSAVIVTESRGGFIGLLASVFGILLFSRKRIRNMIILGIIGLSIFQFLPDHYMGEMQTIQNEQDLTRQDRLYSWRRGWEMFVDNIVVGVGAGNYPWRVEEYELKSDEYDPLQGRLHGGRVAHSLYFTLLPEYGLLGTFIYILIVWKMIRKLKRISSYQKYVEPGDTRRQELILLSRAMAASMLAFFACGAFISVLFYQHLWYLIGFILALEYSMMQTDGSDASRRPAGSAGEGGAGTELVPADAEAQER